MSKRFIYFRPEMLRQLLLGFSSGFPLMLTGTTLQAWMTEEKVDIKTIGLFSAVGLFYGFKALWAPLLDRYPLGKLGRRKGYVLICQLGVASSLFLLSFTSPQDQTTFVAAFAAAIAFFSATQDIALDAYRAESLKADELAAGTGVFVTGYRVAIYVTSAVALILASYLSWQKTFQVMGFLMLLTIPAALTIRESAESVPVKSLKEAIIQPFVEFFTRRGALEAMLFLILYKADSILASAFQTTFLLQTGYTKADIATVVKTFGVFAIIGGTLIGGWLLSLNRFSMAFSLFIFGILQAVTNFAFVWIAKAPLSQLYLSIGILSDNFVSGLGNAAYTAFIMSLCSKKFTATQFALFTSLMGLARTVISMPLGYVLDSLGVQTSGEQIINNPSGWATYFTASVFVAIPGILLALRSSRWQKG